mmetsp:Transcript_655/g.760  ORF Transcript_655/g.760 Transcript_655/m.760 type:complete len:113 (+) Transcript_655:1024-1362(+)
MGSKLKNKEKDDVPGPGNYNPDIKSSKNKSPDCKIGSSSRGNKQKDMVPGPGSYKYYNPNLDKGPHYGIGTEARGKDLKSDTPGPATYRIPVKIIDVPRYLIPNPEEKYKFV